MPPLALFNTLGRRIEPLRTLQPNHVRMYSCGPTVYRYAHIGNFRTYLMADWLRRTLLRRGYAVRQIVNITDVGHMRQEQLDRGEDKIVAAALASGQTPGEIAAFYTAAFLHDRDQLGILPAAVYPRASEHVPQMIAVIERLIASGHAYRAGENVYFSTSSFASYGALSGNTAGGDLLEGVRVLADPEKRDPRDFALWKGAEPGRSLVWDSPWGPGFPGWHIECTAMAFEHLGPSLDIHTGGVDNVFPHHEDERAQSEAASGQRFAGLWLHGQHLLVDGLKMAKSSGNAYTIGELAERGFDPLAFRYLCANAHYRSRLNFTFSALSAAQEALERLRARVRLTAPRADPAWAAPWLARIDAALAADLNVPAALATVWQMLHAPGDEAAKIAALLEADAVLGFGLAEAARIEAPVEVVALAERRGTLRAARRFSEADTLRAGIAGAGWRALDGRDRTLLAPLPSAPPPQGVTSAEQIPSLLDQPALLPFTVALVVNNALDDLRRCIESVLRRCNAESFELLVVDNGSTDGTGAYLADLATHEPRLRVVTADHNLGEGAGRNAALKQARGAIIVLLDTSVELSGDPLPALQRALEEPGSGVAGGFGLAANSLHCFDPTEAHRVDALEGYVLAVRRALLPQLGLMDEKYRFYRNLDLDWSFQARAAGYQLVQTPGLPLVLHPHRVWNSLSEEQREAMSKKNFNRFLHRWRERLDTLEPMPPAG